MLILPLKFISNSKKEVAKMLSHEENNSIKKLLLDEKKLIMAQHGLNSENKLSEQESTGELSMYDNHPADMGTELYEREKDMALEEHAQEQLNKINKALDAMNQGTYGVCSVCSEEIEYERLEVVPTTDVCAKHAKSGTVETDRPVEEQVLEPPHPNSFEHKNPSEVKDYEDSFQEVARFGTSETPSDMAGGVESYDDLYNDETEEGNNEEFESFTGNDIDGRNRKVYTSKESEEYEDKLNDLGIESPLGDIPYKEKDSNVNKKKDKK
jgi:YteA family regulatory protein